MTGQRGADAPSRRAFLGALGAAGLAASGLAGCTGTPAERVGSAQTAELLTSRLPLPARFRTALPIPPMKEASRSDAAGEHHEIVQRVAAAEIMRFTVARKASDDSEIPRTLADAEPVDPSTAAVHREWNFTRGIVHGQRGWTINGRAFHPHRMDARPRLGELEVWRFFTDLHHPVHVHLSSFRVLSRNGGPPRRCDAGWKDTVDVRPAEYVDVAIRFIRFPGRFMMHCHNLEHEDMAMMAAFETVR